MASLHLALVNIQGSGTQMSLLSSLRLAPVNVKKPGTWRSFPIDSFSSEESPLLEFHYVR